MIRSVLKRRLFLCDPEPRISETSSLEPYPFLTDTEPIGGRIKAYPEDFEVSEVVKRPKEDPDGNYTIIDIKLTNWETNRALKMISKRLRISRARIGFGGTKDKRAITRQLISIKGTDINVDELQIKDMEVMDTFRSRNPLKMGHLIGNRFKIKIRESNPGDIDRAREILQKVEEYRGFPNYFGPQRFGTMRPITHVVGKHITAGDLEEAVRTYIGKPYPGESQEAQVARKAAEDFSNLEEALKIYPLDYSFERSMIHYLISNPGDYAGALQELPLNLQLMFVHAYQAALFNKILAKRLEQGLSLNKPEIGDRVMILDKHSLPEQGDGLVVNEDNIKKISRRTMENKAFISGLVIGTDVPFSEGVQGEIEKQVIEEEFGEIDRSRFVIGQIPRLTTKGVRREMLAPVKDPKIWEEDGDIVIEFTLNKGNYATSLLREFFKD